MVRYHVAIIGGGVIGCSIGKHLAEKSDLDVCILEKEYQLAQHQSGRNSGVIHPGFSYEPGSLQAKMATKGARRLKEYCRTHGVKVNLTGVLVIATTDAERERICRLHENGAANGVETELLESDAEIKEHEPYATGRTALYCPEVGSVDFQKFACTLALDAETTGVDFYTGYEVDEIETGPDGHVVRASKGASVEADYVVNAAGLYADRLAHHMGIGEQYQIVPFRGDYYELVPDRTSLVQGNIYPAPHPHYPSVGIHLTRRTDGKVIVGPNVALALGREAYGKTEVNLRDVADTFGFLGFWRFIGSLTALGVAKDELVKAYNKRSFVGDVRSLLPEIDTADLVNSYTGIVAKVMRRDGTLVDEQIFEHGERSTHVLYVIPGMTSSLAIGDHVSNAVLERLD